jgi:CubicO group peptidase (beta-lactamase class C family)
MRSLLAITLVALLSGQAAVKADRFALADRLSQDFRMMGVPGRAFAYSDTGYNLLGLLILDCGGEDFAAFMQREILGPLGMRMASFDWTEAEMPVGHDLRGRPVAPYVYPGRGSGGLFATAGDVARFAAAGMAGSEQDVLSPQGLATLHRKDVAVTGSFRIVADGYGLGHFTETLPDGRAALWHGGQGYGWMSHMHLMPESGDGIVILSNSQRAWPLFAMILRDWSDSLGVAPVGMARVLWAEAAARVAMAALLTVTVLTFWRVIAAGPRRRTLRIGAAVVGGILILWPILAGMQDYLFLFSILPGLWPCFAAASVLTGLSLWALASYPARHP